MLPGVSSRAPCNAAYRCQLHVTGGTAPSPPVSGRYPPSYDCMCAGMLPVAGAGPCQVTVTSTSPTSRSDPAASAQYLPAGNHPLTAAPAQSVSQHIKVKYASFLYELSGRHWFYFIFFYFFLNIGFIFWFPHHAVSFVCSRISEQTTAFIFWVTKLVQVGAEVKTSDKHLLYWKVWRNLANHSYKTCKSGQGLSKAMGVENYKNSLFRASTNGIMWKQHEIWEVNGGIKYTYCMWVFVLRESSAAPGQWDYFVLENTFQHKFLATVLHNQ